MFVTDIVTYDTSRTSLIPRLPYSTVWCLIDIVKPHCITIFKIAFILFAYISLVTVVARLVHFIVN